MTERLRGTDFDVQQMEVLGAYLAAASELLEQRQARHPNWADWRMEQLKLHLRRATILTGWLHDGVDLEGDAARAELRRKRPELFADAPLVDVPRETSPSVEDKFPHFVETLYRVNGGALRTSQRTVQARDVQEAADWARAHLTAAFKSDSVTFCKVNVTAVADGGPIVDVPRETSREGNHQP